MTYSWLLKRDCLFSPELKLAVLVFLGSCLRAVRHPANLFEHALPNFVNRFSAVDNTTRGKIQIVAHALEDWRV